jgi:hypothetical protein
MANIIIVVVLISIMVGVCYFVSGISNIAGTIFERKRPVEKK